MKHILYISVLLLSFTVLAGKDGYKRNPSVDIIHYDFSISISDTNNIIYGQAAITVNFTGSVNTSRI